jgi:hypothetical protein
MDATRSSYILTNVIDLRVWDETAGGYLSVPEESRIACQHCGKLCQKVYEVTTDQGGATFVFGPSCCKKELSGWEPEKTLVRQFEKQAEAQAKRQGKSRFETLVAGLVQAGAGCVVPEIVCVGTKYGHPAYGVAGVAVVCRDGLTDKRRRAIVAAWKREQVRLQAATIENERTREKAIAQAYCDLLV